MPRQRIPTKLKILRGNPGKRPLNMDQPEPRELDSIPMPPRDMPLEGKAHWNDLAPKLLEKGMLTEWDIGAFTMLCLCWARNKQAEANVQKIGLTQTSPTTGRTFPNPCVAIALASNKDYMQWCARFGLTPADRDKVKCDVKSKESPLEKLLRENKAAR